ncbi:LPXTG cell wall anchor domain-containing protein [Amycolatopsis sp. NPDC051102]
MTHVDVVPAAPVEGWLVTGLPAVLLVAVAGLVWRRRRNHLR